MQNTLTLSNTPRKLTLSKSTIQLLVCLGGAVFSFGLASLLHFLWDWSGQYLPSAVFALVNESVWEHVKALCWPFLIWSFAQYHFLRPNLKRLLIARTAGALMIIALTICFFYVYSGVLGYSLLWVDISSAALWLLVAELISVRVLNSPARIEDYWILSAALITLILVMLLCFTVSAPHIGLFQDPITGLYGLEKMP